LFREGIGGYLMRIFKISNFLIALIFLLITLTPCVYAAAGNVWIYPSTKTVNTNTLFDLDVRVDSGTKKLGAFGFTITFNQSLLNIDTTKGTNGVSAGVDGFISAVNTNNGAGKVIINGFNATGTGPGSNLRVLIIHFKALMSSGNANIGLTVSNLTDETGIKIGTPSGSGATVSIQEPQPQEPPPQTPQVTQYNLNIKINPSNGGTVTGSGITCPNDCTESYAQGTTVTLTAMPKSNFVFNRWAGCDSTNGNRCTVSMNSNKYVTAYFNETFKLPLPSGQHIYSYLPVENAVVNYKNPSLCKPFAVGNVTSGILELEVMVPAFSGPVDIYILIYAPQIDQDDIYIVTSEGSIQPRLMGLEPWRRGTYGGIQETLFQVDTSLIPSSIYYLYLLVTPVGDIESYYLWTTYFANPTLNMP
jgi:hypothetical protein